MKYFSNRNISIKFTAAHDQIHFYLNFSQCFIVTRHAFFLSLSLSLFFFLSFICSVSLIRSNSLSLSFTLLSMSFDYSVFSSLFLSLSTPNFSLTLSHYPLALWDTQSVPLSLSFSICVSVSLYLFHLFSLSITLPIFISIPTLSLWQTHSLFLCLFPYKKWLFKLNFWPDLITVTFSSCDFLL